MSRLTQEQLQALNNGPYSRDGVDVPGTAAHDAPLYRAACWAWALAGEFVAVNADTSANKIYEDAFVFNDQHRPIRLNTDYLDLVRAIWPDADAAVTELTASFVAARGGDYPAQQRCRQALMTIAVVANGLTTTNQGAASEYFIEMHTRAENWYAWDHWAIGIRMLDGHTINYVQTVTDIPLKYRCDRVWDEGYFATYVGVDGLLPTHVDVLARVAA